MRKGFGCAMWVNYARPSTASRQEVRKEKKRKFDTALTRLPLSQDNAERSEAVWKVVGNCHCEERKRRSNLFFKQRLLRFARNDSLL
jgi:hypothetical protein